MEATSTAGVSATPSAAELGVLARRWSLMLLRGGVALTAAALMWAKPEFFGPASRNLFCAYAAGTGLVSLAMAGLTRRSPVVFRWALLEAVTSFAATAAALWMPTTTLNLLVIVASWALAVGGVQLSVAARLDEGYLLLAGIGLTALILAGLLLAALAASPLAALEHLRTYIILVGLLFAALAARLRALLQRRSEPEPSAAGTLPAAA